MKTIIAGGRNYKLRLHHYTLLDKLTITEVISGGCSGVDLDGEDWAKRQGVPVRIFEADWNKHGLKAGPIRNEQMAKYANAVVLFPGGRGTDNMYKIAIKYKLKIFDLRKETDLW